MKRFLLPVLLILIAAVALADFPGSPIGGGGGASLSAGSVTSDYILDNSIVNADINSGAAIAGSKLADNSVTGAKLQDNAVDLAGTKVTGTLPVGNLPSGIDAENLGGGAVDNTEYSYLNGVTSAIQTQLNAKQATIGAGDNLTINKLTVNEVVGTCVAADNQCGSTAVNDGAMADNILQAGMCAYNKALEAYQCRNSDNTITTVIGSMVKAFPIIIDNVVAADNVLLFRVPRAITLTRADCYAAVDNVVGNLMECATDNVTNCSVLDEWTVTNAVSPFSDSSMTDGAVAAGAWIRWSTTSVGTASLNRLTCTVQYRE